MKTDLYELLLENPHYKQVIDATPDDQKDEVRARVKKYAEMLQRDLIDPLTRSLGDEKLKSEIIKKFAGKK